MLDKRKIKDSFSKGASTYDGNSLFQREVAQRLFCLLEKCSLRAAHSMAFPGKGGPGLKGDDCAGPGKILDIGCGTGHLTAMLGGISRGNLVFGCDIAHAMLVKAGENFRHLKARLSAGDCETLPFGDSAFDAAVSNLTYQWVPELKTSFGEVFRVLKEGGLFIFSTLGPGTLPELRSSCAEVCARKNLSQKDWIRFAPFTGPSELRGLLEGAGFTVLEEAQGQAESTYSSPLELLKTLKNIGAHARTRDAQKNLLRGVVLKEVLRVYMEKYPVPGGVRATYDTIFFVARK